MNRCPLCGRPHAHCFAHEVVQLAPRVEPRCAHGYMLRYVECVPFGLAQWAHPPAFVHSIPTPTPTEV